MQITKIEQIHATKSIVIVGSDGMFCEMLGRYIEENEKYIVSRLNSIAENASEREFDGYDMMIIHEPSTKSVPWHLLRVGTHKTLKMVIITDHNIWSLVSSYYSKGAHGVILNSMPLNTMINVVRFVMSGEVYAPVEMGLKRRESEVPAKTARGETIAKLVVLGKTNKEICEILNVPMSTVKMDIRILCKKRYARNRTELAVKLAKDTADLDMSA